MNREVLKEKIERILPEKVIKIVTNEKFLKIYYYFLLTLILLWLFLIYFTKNYVVNISPSVKPGIYRVYSLKEGEEIRRGDIVIYKLSKEMQDLSALRGTDIPSMKPVAAFPEDRIEIKDSHIYINGEDFGKVNGNPGLPKFDGFLREDEVLTLSKVENTFDGRYYGGVKRKNIRGKAKLIYEIRK